MAATAAPLIMKATGSTTTITTARTIAIAHSMAIRCSSSAMSLDCE